VRRRWFHTAALPIPSGRTAVTTRWRLLAAGQRRSTATATAEHVFGTSKSWMGATHFLMKRLPKVKTEMSLHVLAYNLKRAMQILGTVPLMMAMRASNALPS